MYIISGRERERSGERSWGRERERILKPAMEEGSGKRHRHLVETPEQLFLRMRANWKKASPHKA